MIIVNWFVSLQWIFDDNAAWETHRHADWNLSNAAAVNRLLSGLQVHHTHPAQMHVGHPANQLQPWQQHPDSRVRRRLNLALGPAALKPERFPFLLLRVPPCSPRCTDVHCKKCLFEHFSLTCGLKIRFLKTVRNCAKVRWFLLLLWPRRLFHFLFVYQQDLWGKITDF